MLRIILLLLLPCSLFAQTTLVVGNVTDGNEPLIGANVILNTEGIPDQLYTFATDELGRFGWTNVVPGRYDLVVSYVGYKDFTKLIEVPVAGLDIGTINLKTGVQLESVTVTAQEIIATQDGDTTSYNANAYKTMPDASAQDLLEKMPTVVIQDGKISAQGEEVKRVLVDGRPFFTDDPKTALEALPAEVIQRIQIFDAQSDQSQFTGFDDGNTTKTINIVTRPDMRAGQFGKAYAGYGTDNRYRSGGNINFFNGDQRISFIGLFNNTNEQNFSSEDLVGALGNNRRRGGRGGRGGGGGGSSDFTVGQQNGISKTFSAGINFSDEIGEALDLNLSYFINRSRNETLETIEERYFSMQENTLYDETSEANSINLNHRVSGRITWEIDSVNSIVYRPRFRWQENEGLENSLGGTAALIGGEESPVNRSRQSYGSDYSAIDFSNNLLYRRRLAKRGRTISLNLSGGTAPKRGDNFLETESFFFNRPPAEQLELLDQRSTLDNRAWNAGLRLNYTEPLANRSRLMFDYRLSYQQEDSEVLTYQYEMASDTELLDDQLSSVFSNDYITHSVGAGTMFRKDRSFIMVRLRAQYAELDNRATFPDELRTERSFRNLLPMVMLRRGRSRGDNLRIGYFPSTQLPSVEQLQNVLDNSNPVQLRIGNPGLAQSYRHRMFARYNKTLTEQNAVLFARISGTLTNDYIGNATYLPRSDDPILAELNIPRGAQLTRPVNLDGAWNVQSLLSYGFPLSFIKSNLNIDLNGGYVQLPGLVDNELNYARTTTGGLGLTLGSNIGERVDFTISSRTTFNGVENSLNTTGDNNYREQRTRLRFNWLLPADIIFRTDATHYAYTGFSDEFSSDYLLWNASLGMKLLKDNRGEISLRVFDILEQNQALSRQVTETYVRDVQSNALQRYVMLQFRYDLRHFGTPPEREERRGRDWGERRGPPPGN